jgi:hypothetical protein
LFILVGSIILWRTLVKSDKDKADSLMFRSRKQYSPLKQVKRTFFIILSILVILSGFTSFILDQTWFLQLNYVYKIPIYSLLGVSICFTLSFIVIDMINYIYNHINQNDYSSRPVISTQNQYSFILMISCVLGVIYGLIFGIMGLEDLSKNYLKAAFIREQNYCIPIGLGFGCITGYINEYIRSEHSETNQFLSVEFSGNDEI